MGSVDFHWQASIHQGFTPVWASEIEPFPIEVTKLHFPDMLHVENIIQLKGAELIPVDVVCGGSPCQDLSVAGKRAGLQGERSGLFMEQVRIIKEMRAHDKSNGRTADAVRPRYMLWENVPRAVSSAGGEDFRAVLEETGRIADSNVSIPRPPGGVWQSAGAILGDQFSVAWRVYDAQYWSVPQRRRRIFLVADFGGRTASQILFEQDRLFGNSSESQEAWEGAAACTEKSIGNTGGNLTGCGDDVWGCLTPWDVQSRRSYESGGVWPSLYSEGGGGHGYVTTEREQSCSKTVPITFACNQRDEVRNLNDIAGAIQAQTGMKQQTFVMCLNDQGGDRMDVTEDITATLRAEMSSHPPLVLGSQPKLFENHGIDSRYTGPHEVAPTMSARYGTGGNNVPLVSQPTVFSNGECTNLLPAETYCIAGNIIDRQDHNGGNGIGVQPDISYTVTATDRHCVFSQQRSDEYTQNDVVSTQSARQYKDATDLVTDVAGLDCRNGVENGDLCGTLQSKTDGGYSLNNVHPVRIGKLIRRLTPLECERLQGFPDYWTDIPGASDSARYKALGNSVAIPCVEHVLRGIAYFLRKSKQEKEVS